MNVSTPEVSLTKAEEALSLASLIEVQLRSFCWLIEEGLADLFNIFLPLEDNRLSLEFLCYRLGNLPHRYPVKEACPIRERCEEAELCFKRKTEPVELLRQLGETTKYSVEECKERGVTYEVPLSVKATLVNKQTGEKKEQNILLCNLPIMSEKGTFIINGAERVIVNQLIRSPGVYFKETIHFTGIVLHSAQLIPDQGIWLEFDIDADGVIWARVGQGRKFPATLLLKALDFLLADSELPKLWEEKLFARSANPGSRVGLTEELEIFPRIASGTDEEILRLFPERKLVNATTANLAYKRPASDIVDPRTKKVIAKAYEEIDERTAKRIEGLNLKEKVEILDISATLAEERKMRPKKPPFSGEEALIEIYRRLRPGNPPTLESARTLLNSMLFDIKHYDLSQTGRYKLNRKLGLDFPLSMRILTQEDIIGIMRYLINLSHRESGYEVDDIDHLENKRVRSAGELLLEQFRIGLLRVERVATSRMSVLNPERATPQEIISAKPTNAVIKSFFGSSQLSQFMDQVNPLAELTHKRRLSVLGPGGLSRQSAKLEVRDVHYSHYGRICPIETPEGPNIGLMTSLAAYCRVNPLGILETPYRRVVDGKVTDEVRYLPADEEDKYFIAPADTPVDEEGRIRVPEVIVRHIRRDPRGITHMFETVPAGKIDFMDISPKQAMSVTTSLIPFLENDDANRALMGSNMQRQAVPLINPEAPLVKTGLEAKAAQDAGAPVLSRNPGIVKDVTANKITIQRKDGQIDHYPLQNFVRSNQSTCIHQKPLVKKGDKVKAGQVLADGPCTDQGELALGRNLLVAFLPWEGYNYEDAILISERLVKEDILTSIHIEQYEVEARDTKLGAEEITRDIPNVGEDMLKQLDERGIISVGAEVKPEDILVGKVAPKGQGELTPEEKIIIAIFGKKAEEMRDVSLRMPHGESGRVIKVSEFSRFKYSCPRCGKAFCFSVEPSSRPICSHCEADLKKEEPDELPPGTNHLVKIWVAQRRKISEGDKLAGRHGNKGVIAKILPEEDMPFLPDGTPVDMVLNPLGVPSRMNVGQILETHLGLVAKELGIHFVNPPFEGMSYAQISLGLEEVCQRLKKRALDGYLSSELKDKELQETFMTIREAASYEEAIHQLRQALEAMPADKLSALAKKLGVIFDVESSERTKPIMEQIQKNIEKRVGLDPRTGKCLLYDGRTGEPFNQPATIGYIYTMKLIHLVEDKIHARSTGPYSLITQQPLGGKAQMGGQRFGEMEVWALEAYGAAHTLQEMLTIKSDDVSGRIKTYESIIKGEKLEEPAVPEAFKLLVKELQGLGLSLSGSVLEPILEEEKGETVEEDRRRSRRMRIPRGEEE